MAKYRLTKNPKKSVNCEVLQENLNGYIVRFDNGMIKNVNKKNVYAFDRIDEAIINEGFVDDIKDGMSKFGKKVVTVVKNFFKDFFKIDNFVFFGSKRGGVMSVSHPINVVEGAENTTCVNYFPSLESMEYSKELGVDCHPVENYTYDSEYNGAIHFPINTNESKRTSFISALTEDANAKAWLKDDDRIQLSGKFGDWSQEEIVEKISTEYLGRVNNDPNVKGLLPLLIWGAPGIGKTSIMRAIKDKFGGHPGIISINGGAVGPDDFTMPAHIKKAFVEMYNASASKTKNQEKIDAAVDVIKDLPKTWLPVYDPTAPDAVIQNAIANGGKVVRDDDGNIVEVMDGPGGIFFIDEYSRFTLAAMDSLMQTPTTREIGSNSTLKFGSRWVIVCAANRDSDMSRKGSSNGALKWETAAKTRFMHVNFVPTYDIWLNWARSKNSTGQNNVLEDICQYVEHSAKKHGGRGDFYEMKRLKNNEELSRDDAYACPRTWEAFSSAIRVQYLKDDISAISSNNKDTGLKMSDIYADMYKQNGSITKYNDVREIPTEKLFSLCESNIGGNPTQRFIDYIGDVDFSLDNARDIMENGDLANTSLQDKIMSQNYNNILKNTYGPTLKAASESYMTDGNISKDALLNMYRYTNKLANVMKSKGSTERVWMPAVYNLGIAVINAAFGIDTTAKNTPYVDAFDYNRKVCLAHKIQ